MFSRTLLLVNSTFLIFCSQRFSYFTKPVNSILLKKHLYWWNHQNPLIWTLLNWAIFMFFINIFTEIAPCTLRQKNVIFGWFCKPPKPGKHFNVLFCLKFMIKSQKQTFLSPKKSQKQVFCLQKSCIFGFLWTCFENSCLKNQSKTFYAIFQKIDCKKKTKNEKTAKCFGKRLLFLDVSCFCVF